MKLSEARLCVECEEIVEPLKRACPACCCTNFIFLVTAAGSLIEDLDDRRTLMERIYPHDEEPHNRRFPPGV
jgi:hypothetical protein